jgi:hypothetical protein
MDATRSTRDTATGTRNWNAWNVALYLFNNYPTYLMVCDAVKRTKTLDDAAAVIMEHLEGDATADGAPYTKTNVRLALQHWGK